MADEYISGEQHRNLTHSSTTSKRQVTVNSHTIITAAIVIVLCVVSFIGGISYQKLQKASGSTTAATANGATGGQTGFGGGAGIRRSGGLGQVTAISTTSITISNQRTNASSTYSISSSTAISDNGQTVDTTDIKSGDTVLVSTSSTTSTAATRILVNPSFGGGFGGNSAGSGTSDNSNQTDTMPSNQSASQSN